MAFLVVRSGAAERDYYRLSELEGVAEWLPRAAEWARPWCSSHLRFRAAGSRLVWPGSLRYDYVSRDGQHRVTVDPILRHGYSWRLVHQIPRAEPGVPRQAVRPGIAGGHLSLADQVGLALAIIQQRALLRERRWVRTSATRPAFREVIANGVITETTCGFRFEGGSGHPTLVSEHLHEAPVACDPSVTFEQAEASVQAYMRALVGESLVTVEPFTPVVEPVENRCLLLPCDNLQCKRLCYWFTAVVAAASERITADEYEGLSAHWRDLTPEERPLLHRPMLLVDAETGEVIEVGHMYRIPPRKGPAALALSINGRSQWLLFPPRLVTDRAYIYVGYLDSLIWDGTVSGRGTKAEVRLNGSTWVFDGETGGALRDGREWTTPAETKVIAGRVYLAAETLSQVTGWRIEYDARAQEVQLGIPEPVARHLARVLKAPAH